MTADEQSVKNIREFMALHYETRVLLVERAITNFERARRGLDKLPTENIENERHNKGIN